MPIEQICHVVENTHIQENIFWMVLEVGKLVEKQGLFAGQFLHVACGNQFLRRPLSVALASRDEPEDLVALIFEVKGAGTRWLSERVRGDAVRVLGPLGNGFSMEESGRYLLAGGGIGCPPLLGYAVYGGKRTSAVLGFRTRERVILADHFRESCADVFLCTDDGSLGRKCFVHEQVREMLAQDSTFTAVLACGPRPMLQGVAQVAGEFGVPCQVSLEERMACGVGACLGCAVEMADGSMKHVCKDGPVFDASEVKWNG